MADQVQSALHNMLRYYEVPGGAKQVVKTTLKHDVEGGRCREKKRAALLLVSELIRAEPGQSESLGQICMTRFEVHALEDVH